MVASTGLRHRNVRESVPQMPDNRQRTTGSARSALDVPTAPMATSPRELRRSIWREKQLLVIVDAYSKCSDVHICHSTSSAGEIEKLRMSFSSQGLPAVLVTDDSTAFKSPEFQAFMRGNRILHKFSPPLNPASNGQAEAMVKVVKTALAKRTDGSLQTRLSRFLFLYRNTPHTTTGRSPAELLLGRPLRTPLDQLHPDIAAKVARQQYSWKHRADQSASDRQFQFGDRVYVTAITNAVNK